MKAWIEEVYETKIDESGQKLGPMILRGEAGRKTVSQAAGISMWEARQAIKAIRGSGPRKEERESNWDIDRGYSYNEALDQYIFFLSCYPEAPYPMDGAVVRRMQRAYSDYDDSPATIDQIAVAEEIPREVFIEIKDTLGFIHSSVPRTDEELKEGDVADLVEKDLYHIKHEYKTKLQREVWNKLKRDAKRWRRKEVEIQSLFSSMSEKLVSDREGYEVEKIEGDPNDNGALVFNLQDLHIGNRPEDDEHDMDSYMQSIRGAVRRIALRASRISSLDKIYVVVGGDLLDVDNYQEGTTRGTPQDVQARPYKILMMAQSFMVSLIDDLRQLGHLVELIPVFGNHDRLLSLAVYQYAAAWFNECNDVVAPEDYGERVYRQYENHLIACTHGDISKSKFKELPSVVIGEAREMFGATKNQKIFTGHLHHELVSVDLAGFKLYQAPYPGKPSRWASESLYGTTQRGIHGVLMFANSADDALLGGGVDG